VFAAGVLCAPVAAAQDAPTDSGTSDSTVGEVDDAPKKKKKKDLPELPSDGTPSYAESGGDARSPSSGGRKRDDSHGRVEVFGRVAVRGELERHERAVLNPDDPRTLGRVDSFDLTVPRARFGVRYRAPVRWLSAEVEVDAADGFELFDAWIRARNENFSARAGQFKVPFSAIQMESSFDLPMVRRGLVDDILVEELEVAGRRPGIALGARQRDGLRPSLVVGVFQGSVLIDDDPDDRDVEPFSERALDAQSAVVRGEMRVFDDVTLGLNYAHRVGTDIELEPRHYWTFGGDAVFDAEFGKRGVRVWAEVLSGASWFEHRLKPIDARDATFFSVRLIGAFRFGGTRREECYLEPYGMLAMLDPDTDVHGDLVVEEAIGVNVGLWKRVRIGLELELQKAQPNFPARYFLGENGDRKAVVLGGQMAF
jgi:hypothetical protein